MLVLAPGYLLVYQGHLQLSDGVYYLASGEGLSESGTLRNHIFDPPTQLITPQIGHILITALAFSLPVLEAQAWLIIFQLTLAALTMKCLADLTLFHEELKTVLPLSVICLALLNPELYRALTSFYGESLYFFCFLLFLAIFELFRRDQRDPTFFGFITILSLSFLLVLYRLQALATLVPLVLLALRQRFTFTPAYAVLAGSSLGAVVVFITQFYLVQLTPGQLLAQPELDKVFYYVSVLTKWPYFNVHVLAWMPEWAEITILILTLIIMFGGAFALLVREPGRLVEAFILILSNMIFLSFLEPTGPRYAMPMMTILVFYTFVGLASHPNKLSSLKIPLTFGSSLIAFSFWIHLYVFEYGDGYDYDLTRYSTYSKFTEDLDEMDGSTKLYCADPRSVYYYTGIKCASSFGGTSFEVPTAENPLMALGSSEQLAELLQKYSLTGRTIRQSGIYRLVLVH